MCLTLADFLGWWHVDTILFWLLLVAIGFFDFHLLAAQFDTFWILDESKITSLLIFVRGFFKFRLDHDVVHVLLL